MHPASDIHCLLSGNSYAFYAPGQYPFPFLPEFVFHPFKQPLCAPFMFMTKYLLGHEVMACKICLQFPMGLLNQLIQVVFGQEFILPQRQFLSGQRAGVYGDHGNIVFFAVNSAYFPFKWHFELKPQKFYSPVSSFFPWPVFCDAPEGAEPLALMCPAKSH